jgi:hypothetical protein
VLIKILTGEKHLKQGLFVSSIFKVQQHPCTEATKLYQEIARKTSLSYGITLSNSSLWWRGTITTMEQLKEYRYYSSLIVWWNISNWWSTGYNSWSSVVRRNEDHYKTNRWQHFIVFVLKFWILNSNSSLTDSESIGMESCTFNWR